MLTKRHLTSLNESDFKHLGICQIIDELRRREDERKLRTTARLKDSIKFDHVY
jgi:hypothetical protein